MKIFNLTTDNKSTLFLDKQKCLTKLEQIILSALEPQNISEKEKFEIKCAIETNEIGDKTILKFNNIELVFHTPSENQILSLEMIEHNFLSTQLTITELEVIE